ncbi:hypothetical protein [Corynebacterium cystitidis]|uniref:SWIM-type domain-containing protein n=1 Tax=Corynebacterium cystitidis DSM 20524 TaxID=1121357 RepID=A0A1H9PTF7_9CORY|nr:hypothetical protein [Corynebacterium cystitidis]WJY82389.1 hypothetical protein CCYS_07325 [Corynebacterium cystitidis DSM 20524]SER51472.1 hypothetical protein SAMN05661109_00453 [Corynebacterium cystitidis DSM 20524]SNV76031.1 Uncharacterised protein [Corynebacterium cystitidis]
MTNLAPIRPSVAEALLARIPQRLRDRATTMTVDAVDRHGTAVTVGKATVTITEDSVQCSCLLSPQCAHIAAVIAAAPQAVEASVEASAANTPTPPPPVAEPVSASTSQETARIVATLDELFTEVAHTGLTGMGEGHRQRLASLTQDARVAGIHRLERSLTSMIAQLYSSDPDYDAVTEALVVTHRLVHNPADPDLTARVRHNYKNIDLGANGRLTPLWAEPVVELGGFAGIRIVFSTPDGQLYSISKTPPGEASNVYNVWNSAVRLGDLHCTYAELSRRTLLITGAAASSDGSLQRGKKARAVQGAEATYEKVRDRVLEGELTWHTGEIGTVTTHGVHIGGKYLDFTPGAKQLDLDTFSAWLTDHLGDTATCLADRDNQLLALWIAGRRYLPGLDRPRPTPRPLVASTSSDQPFDNITASPQDILKTWATIAFRDGRQGLANRFAAVTGDADRLEECAAPTAARLLRRAVDGSWREHCSLGVYYLYKSSQERH